MAENSKIEWTHHTFNPWWGCAKVSPACDNCYAERDANRFTPNSELWGALASRREFGNKHWNAPLAWNRKAQTDGVRYRVFSASMADVFDKNAPDGARERLFELIKATPHLDWLLLTKRIGNAARMLPADWDDGYPNVWLGISAVNQEEANRDIPKLLALPARIRWLSMEPLLGPVDLAKITHTASPGFFGDALEWHHRPHGNRDDKWPGIDWVVVGGESGPNARPMHPAWARSLRDQCTAAGVPFLFKQWGEWIAEGVQMPEPLRKALDHDTRRWVADDADDNPYTRTAAAVYRVGKKAAGRLLDGVTHDGYPAMKGGEA